MNLEDAALDLKPLNIIVGANNSGKTNFLNVKNLMRALLKGGREGQDLINESLYNKTPLIDGSGNFSFRISYDVKSESSELSCLYSVEIRRPYFLESRDSSNSILHYDILNEELTFKEQGASGPYRKFFTRNADEITFGPQVEKNFPKALSIAGTVSVIELITSLNISPDLEIKPIIDGLIEYCDSTTFSGHAAIPKSHEGINLMLKTLFDAKEKKSEMYDRFSMSFREALCLKDFDIHEFRVPISADEKQTKSYYFCFVQLENATGRENVHSLSDGSLLLFRMIFEIIFNPHGLIFIDEPEIGLHPRALNSFFDFLRLECRDKKVVLTTHSSYLLNIVDPALVTIAETNERGKVVFSAVLDIPDLQQRLKSKYVNFGDLLVDGFRTKKINFDLD